MEAATLILAGEIAGAVLMGVLAGFGAIYIFNKMPAGWLCDYGETPDPVLSDPQVQRVKGFPWRWIYAAGFTCLLIRLVFVDLQFAAAALFACWALLITGLADLKYSVIPDQFTIMLALSAMGFIPFHDTFTDVIFGALIGGGVMIMVSLLGGAAYKKEVMGFGDVKLFASLGLVLGVQGTLIALVGASITAGAAAAAGLASGRYKKDDARPLGPFISGWGSCTYSFCGRFSCKQGRGGKTRMKRNILLTIAYDGTGFHGWQRQPEAVTVQGYLEQIMSRLFRAEILLNGTSRTDAGVHAYGQRASFISDLGIPVEKIPLVVNNALCGAERGPFAIAPIRILAAEEKPMDFHARFDSVGKEYIYRITTAEPDLFRRNYVYHVKGSLDTATMEEALGAIRGTHDFKSFEASGGTPRETTVRTIYDARIVTEETGDVTLYIRGDGFLYNMVRIITGTLVDIGTGKIRAEEMPAIIDAADRSAAGHTAPPYGLYLSEVFYDAERLKASAQED